MPVCATERFKKYSVRCHESTFFTQTTQAVILFRRVLRTDVSQLKRWRKKLKFRTRFTQIDTADIYFFRCIYFLVQIPENLTSTHRTIKFQLTDTTCLDCLVLYLSILPLLDNASRNHVIPALDKYVQLISVRKLNQIKKCYNILAFHLLK